MTIEVDFVVVRGDNVLVCRARDRCLSLSVITRRRHRGRYDTIVRVCVSTPVSIDDDGAIVWLYRHYFEGPNGLVEKFLFVLPRTGGFTAEIGMFPFVEMLFHWPYVPVEVRLVAGLRFA